MPDDTLLQAVQKWLNQSKCHLGCGLGWAQGSMCMAYEHPDLPHEGAILGERTCHGVPDNTL